MSEGSVALVAFQPASGAHTDPGLAPAVEALTERGVWVDTPAWDDQRIDWAQFDLAVLKCPWDYQRRQAEFSQWLDRTSKLVPMLNHPRLVRWNIDKSYLLDLAKAGVRIPDMRIVRNRTAAAWFLRGCGWERVVVKPTVSAGSANTGLFHPADVAALDLVERIVSLGKHAILCRAVPSVQRRGEHALLFFDGQFSHAVTKGPILAYGGGLLGGEYVENVEPAVPYPAEVPFAERCIGLAAGLARPLPEWAAMPLYGRVDLAQDADGSPVLLELELFEPDLFCGFANGAIDRYADAVLRRMKMVGPGRANPRSA